MKPQNDTASDPGAASRRTTPLSLPPFSGWDRAFYLLFGIVLLVTLLTFRDYGYSMDEVWHNRWNGQAITRFFLTLGKDRSSIGEYDFSLYGGIFDAPAEWFVTWSPLEPRNSRHLANLAAGLCCLWGTWCVGRRYGGPQAGFWAALFLVASAPFYGHLFINAKDIPFAAGYIWSLYFLGRVLAQLPAPPLRTRLGFGLTLGFTLGMRIGGVVIFAYYALFALLFLALAAPRSAPLRQRFPLAGGIVRSSLPIVGVSWLVMISLWPAALLHPMSLPFRAIEATAHFATRIPVLWNGDYVLSTDLPWGYLPLLFAVQLPEILVLLFLVAVPWSLVQIARSPWREWPPVPLGTALLLLAASFPPLWAILTHATLYDNLRQFIFVLPPLCCLGGMFLAALFSRPGWCRGVGRWLSTGVLLLALGIAAGQMAALHPYEYTYFNAFAGGVPAGSRRFETDYWVTSYREAAAIVVAHARNVAEKQGVPFSAAKFTVALVASSSTVEEVFPPQFVLYDFGLEEFRLTPAAAPSTADYLIATTRWGGDRNWPEYPLIGKVERRGMTFAVVKVSPDLAAVVEGGVRPPEASRR